MATRTNQSIKIKPIAYNYKSEPDTGIVSGESFNCSKPFLILSSMSIPKNACTYMEVTITYHPENETIRHLPFYLGIHKEPSMGVLCNDCVLASVYYTTTEDYKIFEKHRGEVTETDQTVPKLYAKIPIVNTVIGIGVDVFSNTITLYSDGKKFYSFQPSTFRINDSKDKWYFAIYNSTFEALHGKINFGRYRTEYLPDGYCTLYQQYWNHETSTTDIDCKMEVPGIAYPDYRIYDFPAKINPENSIAPISPEDGHRHLSLIYKRDGMKYEGTNSFQMVSNETDPDLATINFPCPINQKVYVEVNVKEGTFKDGFYGIPIQFGLTSKINDYTEKSFRVNLYHRKGDTYRTFSEENGNQLIHTIPEITNPSTPVQPHTVGMVFDLANQHIQVITDNTIFADIPIEGANFSHEGDIVYIFFKSADESYTGTLYGVVNFGEDVIDFQLDKDVKSLYDYWNDCIKFYLGEPFPGFECRMKVRPYYNKYNSFVYCSLTVPRLEAVMNGFTPGLNMLMDSYNVVSDTQPYNNTPVLDPFEFAKRVDEDLKTKCYKKFLPESTGFESMITIENYRYLGFDLLMGQLALAKDVDIDFDAVITVSKDPVKSAVILREILGIATIRRRRHIENLLEGEVTIDKNLVSKDISGTVTLSS